MAYRKHAFFADDTAKQKHNHKKSDPAKTYDGNFVLRMARPETVMHLQRTVGNRATQRLLARKSHRPLASPVIQQYTPANGQLQRRVRFVGDEWRQNGSKYNNLARVIFAARKGQPILKQLFADPNMVIEIKVDDRKDPNPADIVWSFGPMKKFTRGRHTGKLTEVKARGTLQIRKWFVDAYDLGTAVSTINHELGVHLLPFFPHIAMVLANTVVHKEDLKHVQDLSQNEQDHQAAVDPTDPNSKIYWEMVRTTANTLVGMKKQKDAKSAVFAYLMDCAAMDDAGNKIALPFFRTKAGLGHIKKRYAEFWARISKDKGLKKDALPDSAISKWQITKEYLKLYWRVLKMLTARTQKENTAP